MDKMSKNYKFAQQTGYKGTFTDYLALNYQGYRDTCNRCGIEPMTMTEWLETR